MADTVEPVTGEPELFTRKHIMFLLRSLKFLPTPYQAEDGNRMTLAYFCLSGLALLPASAVSTSQDAQSRSALDVMITDKQRLGYVDWVYSQQLPTGGFRGSDSLVLEEDEYVRGTLHAPLSPAHVIQSYTALLILGLLNDDFTRMERPGLTRFLKECQNDDGSFTQFPGCPEPGDPRSTYSAFVIASIMEDWSGIDVEKALTYLRTCQRPDGGFATSPGLEAHGGYTYLTIASFVLASKFTSIPRPNEVLRWLVGRQLIPTPPTPTEEGDDEEDTEAEEEGEKVVESQAGFQGRVNKPTDACYSFWCTAGIHLLKPDESLLQDELDRAWLQSCQHGAYGGIAREPGSLPDVYHTYLSLATLSLGGQPGLKQLDAAWNVSVGVANRIRNYIGALKEHQPASF